MSINHHAHTYLRAFLQGGRFAGGLRFEEELRALRLDFTAQSLERIDALLDTLRSAQDESERAFLLPQANQNFLYLLAFYVGETVAHLTDATVNWYSHEELAGRSAGFSALGRGFHTSAVCRYNQSGNDRSDANFAPLVSIMTRLFEDDSRSVAYSAQGVIELLQEANGPAQVDLRSRLHALTDEDRHLLRVSPPTWLATDPLRRAFDVYPSLLLSGRVVWARVLQAPAPLFEAGDEDLAGSVIYEPTGRISHMALIEPARRIAAFIEHPPQNPALIRLARMLGEHGPHEFGVPVPAAISPHSLLVSSVLFHREHLPDRKLDELCLPIVLSDRHPGLVMVLPFTWWPEEFLARLHYRTDQPESMSLAS
jgi:hypothetical protein